MENKEHFFPQGTTSPLRRWRVFPRRTQIPFRHQVPDSPLQSSHAHWGHLPRRHQRPSRPPGNFRPQWDSRRPVWALSPHRQVPRQGLRTPHTDVSVWGAQNSSQHNACDYKIKEDFNGTSWSALLTAGGTGFWRDSDDHRHAGRGYWRRKERKLWSWVGSGLSDSRLQETPAEAVAVSSFPAPPPREHLRERVSSWC